MLTSFAAKTHKLTATAVWVMPRSRFGRGLHCSPKKNQILNLLPSTHIRTISRLFAQCTFETGLFSQRETVGLCPQSGIFAPNFPVVFKKLFSALNFAVPNLARTKFASLCAAL